MFASEKFYQVLWNSIRISFLKIAIGFPGPIIFALLLNEVRQVAWKKSFQTISYLPHFVSWVVVGGIVRSVHGVVNGAIGIFGAEPRLFLQEMHSFLPIVITSMIWKNIGGDRSSTWRRSPASIQICTRRPRSMARGECSACGTSPCRRSRTSSSSCSCCGSGISWRPDSTRSSTSTTRWCTTSPTSSVPSFSTPENVYSVGFRLWPRPATFDAYRDVLSKDTVGIAYYNTVLRTVAGTPVTLFVSFSAAYALARRTLPLNKTITLLMIFTMFFSGGLIATYLWMGQMGLHNNRLALILPPAASAYYYIIMRNFFRAIPPELEESSFMDGASAYTVLLRIIVPVSMPAAATIALWSAVFHWDSWFDALLYTPKREQLVLQLMLRRILIEHQASNLFDLSVDELESSFVVETIKAATLYWCWPACWLRHWRLPERSRRDLPPLTSG